ncbi:MAG: glycoside hydrolase family 2 protein, partial [Blautia sp.]|nr:glycoside hydrolase family 2 protein [Blautia sp.]
QDRNIFSPVMENHQKNPGANGKIISYLAQTFRYPENFDDLLYLTQVLQGMAMRFGVDHFRRNRGRCMGALYWQLNDNWPVASWASLDYYGRWKALHYMAKRFYDPLAISILVEEDKATLYVENETLMEQGFEARLTLRNMYTEVVGSAPATEVTMVPALTSLPVLTLPLPKKKAEEKRGIYVEGKLRFANGKVVRVSEPLVPFKSLELLKADIHAEVEVDEEAYVIRLVCPVYAPFVELSLEGTDAIFSDNYFDLSDGEGVEVRVERKDLSLEEALTKEEFLEKLRIRSLGDTYLGK